MIQMIFHDFPGLLLNTNIRDLKCLTVAWSVYLLKKNQIHNKQTIYINFILFMQSKFAKAVASGTLSCKVETRQQYREIPNNQPTPFEA